MFRQVSQARVKKEKERLQEEKLKAQAVEGVPAVPDVSGAVDCLGAELIIGSSIVSYPHHTSWITEPTYWSSIRLLP